MKRDQLDQAIDHVAARLVRVDDNDALASQILNALPERASWFGWLFHSWAPRLAMIVVVVAAGIALLNRGSEVTPGVSPLASFQPVTTPTQLVTSVREAEPNRTRPLERLEPLEPLEPQASIDFEGSLPALELSVLAPVSLPEDALLIVAPLAIADLPLTVEPVSQR